MRTLTLAAAFCGLLALPAIAEAASGFSTANVNMRSGPSTAYPAVTLIPVGAPLRINGCLADIPWCDVSFAGGRGWVAGRYVQALYQQRRVYVDRQYYRPLGIPTITFDLDNYWDRNYRGRDFYRDRDHWAQGPNWGRNGGNPVYRQPPPAYDPQDDDQPNWQRQRPRPPAYDPDDDQGGNNPPPRFRPRYGDNDGQPRYGNQPDQGNYGDDNQPRRRPPQQQQQQDQSQQQQQRPPQGQPPRQQPQQQQPQQQPQAQQPPPQAQPPQPQAQQPAANQPPRLIRRNDGQVVQCPDGTNSCAEPHSSHN